jgi:hypothetical protein
VLLRPVIVGLALATVGSASVPVVAAAQASDGGATCPAVAGRSSAPSPSRILGRVLTARAPSPTDTTRVLTAIGRVSPRVTVGDAGRSDQGRPLAYAIVGDPASLDPERRATIERRVRSIRAGDVGRAAAARAARGPAIVWLGGGVHANEPSGTTALLETVHRLATDGSCTTRRILRHVLTVVVPDQNPDGHVRATRTDASGFDLNRDWFAAGRPETRARLDLLRRLPPVVAIDLHEQTGRDYFTPPYEEPIVAGLPSAIRRFADATVAPAVGRALRRTGAQVATASGYDLLYPGYADSATSLLLGSGGMTFEQGSDLPLATKTTRHLTAALTALGTVAAHRRAAIDAWVAGYRTAVASGRRRRTVTGRTVAAWVLRIERRAADARRLAERLRDVGVDVRTLRRPVTVARYRAAGSTGAASRERLPAGTLVVPSDQPLQRWADVLLGREPRPERSGGDVDTWSLPRLSAVSAGIAESPIPRTATRALAPTVVADAPTGHHYVLPGDSTAAAVAAARLLGVGTVVARRADGSFTTPATAATARMLQAAHIDARSDPGADPAADPLRAPDVVVVADDGPAQIGPPALLPATGGDQPSGWIPASLRDSGVPHAVRSAGNLSLGVRPGTTHVIVGPGTIAATRSPAALATSLRSFVAGGGRLIAVGSEGHRTLVDLGLSAVRSSPAPDDRAATTVAATPTGTVWARALGGPTRVVWHRDDRIDPPPGGVTLLQTPAASWLGPAATALAVAEPLGRGQVVTLGFSPVFRGQSAGGLRVLLGLLLS